MEKPREVVMRQGDTSNRSMTGSSLYSPGGRENPFDGGDSFSCPWG